MKEEELQVRNLCTLFAIAMQGDRKGMGKEREREVMGKERNGKGRERERREPV